VILRRLVVLLQVLRLLLLLHLERGRGRRRRLVVNGGVASGHHHRHLHCYVGRVVHLVVVVRVGVRVLVMVVVRVWVVRVVMVLVRVVYHHRGRGGQGARQPVRNHLASAATNLLASISRPPTKLSGLSHQNSSPCFPLFALARLNYGIVPLSLLCFHLLLVRLDWNVALC